jgi:hypothetical protein
MLLILIQLVNYYSLTVSVHWLIKNFIKMDHMKIYQYEKIQKRKNKINKINKINK